jgi:hypothetical protein
VSDAGFSLADVAVSSYLLYVIQFFPQVVTTNSFQQWGQVIQYMRQCASRPLYAKAFGHDVQQFVLNQLAKI